MTLRDLTPWWSLALKEKLSEGLLTIKGERNSEKENDEKDKHYHRIEPSHRTIERAMSLPSDVAETARRADILDTARVFIAAMRNLWHTKTGRSFPPPRQPSPYDLDRLTDRLPNLDEPLFGPAHRDS